MGEVPLRSPACRARRPAQGDTATVDVGVCVCVLARARQRERDRDRHKARERETPTPTSTAATTNGEVPLRSPACRARRPARTAEGCPAVRFMD
jgi:hypothetical protein